MKAKVEARRSDLVRGGEVADKGKLSRGEDLSIDGSDAV